jgi:hypothetical protein
MTEYTKYTITENADGFVLAEERGESVYPHTQKATAREVVARLMQLMEIGPVAPQTYPERVCIGFTETEAE